MKNKIQLLDCTLRDGAYVVDGNFGEAAIEGIAKKLQEAHIDIIEIGWLKNPEYKEGTTFFHVPADAAKYIAKLKNSHSYLVAMIDYDRYNIENLPPCDGKTIDAIRIVFPYGKADEGIRLVKPIKEKGYKVFLQAANTMAYSDYDLITLADKVNEAEPEALSIVDTFGAMSQSDLHRIFLILNNNLKKTISLGFHSHNNRQLSFALSIQFIDSIMNAANRKGIVDCSLCGMGRGAGNTPLELMTDYLNNSFASGYDMNAIMDVIDIYMGHFMEKYHWGYSTPNMLAGIYQCHVNNVEYLTKTHRSKSKDIKIILDSMSKEERRTYDYDMLEELYADYQNKAIDDTMAKDRLKEELFNKEIVAVAPGSSAVRNFGEVDDYIKANKAVVIGINSVLPGYEYDYFFFSNSMKYEISKIQNAEAFQNATVILTSNIKTTADTGEIVINYNDLQKRGWKYYDNSMIMFLRFMCFIMPSKIAIAGFDGYSSNKGASYASSWLIPPISHDETLILHEEIKEMLMDYMERKPANMQLQYLTPTTYIE